MTKRQSEVLKFIKGYIKTNGYSPSLRDICVGLDIKSTAQVFLILKALKEQKKVKYAERRARTLEVV